LRAYHDRSVEILRLSDMRLMEDLSDALPGLLELDYRRRHDAMARWVGRAHEVLSRQHLHRATLERLRQSGTRSPAESGPQASRGSLDSTRGQQENWSFADTTTQWQHDLLQKLTAKIDELQGAPERLARVESWLRGSPSGRQIDLRWRSAASFIEARYGFELKRREGLVPLGLNEASGLWEFVDLKTGLEPNRDQAGNLVVAPETGVVLVLVPGGRFRMGSPPNEDGRKHENEAQHDAEVGPFMISKYEITQEQWLRLMGHTTGTLGAPCVPAGDVTWFTAQDFCRKAGYRLPTEAQWEYACRAETTGPYSDTVPLEDLGWFKENSGNEPQPVGKKRANPFGLYDVHGNVLEWCQDLFEDDFYLRPEASEKDPVNDPPNADRSPRAMRVLRGGPYNGQPAYCRSADRYGQPPTVGGIGHGLRPVLLVP
jgi:formylglycine-generating enzyme required for sulfatase activity